jgi:hypothetical protein
MTSQMLVVVLLVPICPCEMVDLNPATFVIFLQKENS